MANLSMPGTPPLISRTTGRAVLPVSFKAAVLAAHERSFSRLLRAQGRSAAATRVSTLASGGGTYTHWTKLLNATTSAQGDLYSLIMVQITLVRASGPGFRFCPSTHACSAHYSKLR
jgi:hypothetical protein